jgi:preprotein translocase subunit YajC
MPIETIGWLIVSIHYPSSWRTQQQQQQQQQQSQQQSQPSWLIIIADPLLT